VPERAFAQSREYYAKTEEWLASAEPAGLQHAELEEQMEARGRELVRRLFQGHLDLLAAREERRHDVTGEDGIARTRAEKGHVRVLASKFGQVSVSRMAYRAQGSPNVHPLDAVLNLPAEEHSHGLRKLAAIEAARGSHEGAASAITRATGVKLGKRQAEELVLRAAADADGFCGGRRPVPAPDDHALVLTFDGKGIVMRPDAPRPAAPAEMGCPGRRQQHADRGRDGRGRPPRRYRRDQRVRRRVAPGAGTAPEAARRRDQRIPPEQRETAQDRPAGQIVPRYPGLDAPSRPELAFHQLGKFPVLFSVMASRLCVLARAWPAARPRFRTSQGTRAMRRRPPILTALAATAAAVATIGLAAPAAYAGALHGSVLPRHVFAPYFETYNTTGGSIAADSRASGARYMSLAFLQTAQAGSCTADWNGDTTEPISHATFGADIAAVQARGGNVIPSFGGFAADTTGTELADSCTSVPAVAAVFESLITTYHVPRIDLDIEGDSVNNTAGINRRNEAIAMTERWAAAHGRHIQFSYTLPTFPTGLTTQDVAILQNAIDDHARIATVDLLTFDYFLGNQQDMVADTESAAAALVTELHALFPRETTRQLWQTVGVTEMPGIDDFGPDETFAQADAATILHWADQHGVGFLSFWAVQRDNGTCPGTQGAGACSGLVQPDWFFSHAFEPFTRFF
jgi:hypothetical protein